MLGAAGHRVPRRRGGPAGLTAREVEVLRLLARGLSNREIAERLVISPKTAGNHIEHIYAKIDASSRATASLFAMQHGLLPDGRDRDTRRTLRSQLAMHAVVAPGDRHRLEAIDHALEHLAETGQMLAAVELILDGIGTRLAADPGKPPRH